MKTDHDGQQRNGDDASGRSEIAEFFTVLFMLVTDVPFAHIDLGPVDWWTIACNASESAGACFFNSSQCKIESFCSNSSPARVSSMSASRRSGSLWRRVTTPRSTIRLINSTVL